MHPPLPIDDVLPELIGVLSRSSNAVLVAPPGAGKTTRVPLVLAEQPWAAGRKIIVLEPRRIAASAAAARMAASLREGVGATVGYRVRFGSQVSPATRIEVVTEGIFTRLILDDPGLEGVAAVLFDEFHERSLDADLGLALARDVQEALRDDLKLVVMSATLDGEAVARALGRAPVIESAGRAFPVDTRYLGRDLRIPIERTVADAVARAVRVDEGSLLVFLPGAGEIRRTEPLLRERIRDPAIDIVALHGSVDGSAQDRAIAPLPPPRRKIVLATSIAETSLTIEGVRVVVDCGLARVPRYEPDVGLTRLETVRVSRASADQRRGRAGRTEPGVCYRLWEERQTASLEPVNRPEILAADLSGFVLDLAAWGASGPGSLEFIDPPPAPAIAQAKALLRELGALEADGRITPTGKALRTLPLAPRLARMMIDAAAFGEATLASEIALALSERGLGGNDVDLAERIEALRHDASARARTARAAARRWAETARNNAHPTLAPEDGGLKLAAAGRPAEKRTSLSIGALLALAYPDRVAKSRGADGSFLLANGRGGRLDVGSPLAREPLLAVAELTGSAAQGRIMLAAPIALADIETLFAAKIEAREEVFFDQASAGLRARRLRGLGALVLSSQPVAVAPEARNAQLLSEGIARLGIGRLPWTKALHQWRDRVMFLRRAQGEEWPDLSDAVLARTATDWLAPALIGKTALAELDAQEFAQSLHALLPWTLRGRLGTEAPTHFAAPSGSSVAIDYGAEEGPKISVRVQELFGLDRHPGVAGGRIALVVELLSPAHRPVQVTRDLPGFWRGSYAAVRSELRGRYPRHPWPDDPLCAAATARAKRRGKNSP